MGKFWKISRKGNTIKQTVIGKDQKPKYLYKSFKKDLNAKAFLDNCINNKKSANYKFYVSKKNDFYKNLLGTQTEIKNLDVVFCLDTTLSMGPYIKKAVSTIKRIMDDVQKNANTMNV